jgi:hypothetical protein
MLSEQEKIRLKEIIEATVFDICVSSWGNDYLVYGIKNQSQFQIVQGHDGGEWVGQRFLHLHPVNIREGRN